MAKVKILVLGKNGMLGSMLFRIYDANRRFETYGTVRIAQEVAGKNILQAEATNLDSIRKAMEYSKPDLVVNCIGLINKRVGKNSLEEALQINGKFPHHLADICRKYKSRLIHFSTDCVFSGQKGRYIEQDKPDTNEWYGLTKLTGEVTELPALTIRTSLIGPEMSSKYGLLEWFLSQKGVAEGYTNAIFSGFPTVEIARVISDFIIPQKKFSGLYHISSNPISKYDLLQLIARRYKKDIKIRPLEEPKIDRSLNSEKFRELTGYQPPSWSELIDKMYLDHKQIK